jgi:hypothetical protein
MTIAEASTLIETKVMALSSPVGTHGVSTSAIVYGILSVLLVYGLITEAELDTILRTAAV